MKKNARIDVHNCPIDAFGRRIQPSSLSDQILPLDLQDQITDTTEWQTSCQNIKTRFKKLLDNKNWTDCQFVVSWESNRTIIKCHKLLLATTSPVFEAMFYGSMSGTDEIIISDIKPKIFEALLQYIYSDEININIISDALELYYSAKKYIIPHLAKECVKYMTGNLKTENVCQVYEVAKLFDENNLINSCIKMITTRTIEVLTKINFEEIKIETIIFIFKLENLAIKNELDLFNALLNYANAQKENQVDQKLLNENNQKPINFFEEITPTNVKNKSSSTSSIRDAMKNIRFLTLTPGQFAEGPAKSGLLTKDECLAFFMKISSPSSNFEIPEGFTTVKSARNRMLSSNIYGQYQYQ